MAVRLLLPFQRGGAAPRWPDNADPLSAFRRDMNRLFEEFLNGFGAPGALAAAPQAAAALLTPQINVSETDQEVRITAELPGLDEDDVEVALADDSLTISGEKEAEQEEVEEAGERRYHVMERASGAFSRTLQLPFPVDPDEVEAVFKNGVLAITIAKPPAVQQKQRKIAIKGADAPLTVDRAAAGDKPGDAAAKASRGEAE